MSTLTRSDFYPPGRRLAAAQGLRPEAGGTHTSRTIMLEELAALLRLDPEPGDRPDYAEAIIGANCLGKETAATRRLSNKRLGELYALDPRVPIFRILRRLWKLDEPGRPLMALLVALARDPLLLATAPAILALKPGDELPRSGLRAAISQAAGERLSEAVADKVLRNAASSWTQAGHLEGRTFKHRRPVRATPAPAALALWIACQAGFSDTEAFGSGWLRALDCEPPQAMELGREARRLRLIGMDVAEQVVTLDFARLDGAPWRR